MMDTISAQAQAQVQANLGASLSQAQSAASSIGIDWNTSAANATFQAQLNREASPDVQAQIAADAQTAAQDVAAGKALTDDQIKGIFVSAATGVAVAAGVSASVAGAVFAPMAAFVYGGGYFAGQAIQRLLSITNAGTVSCSPEDHHQGGSSPSDPAWNTYAQSVQLNLSHQSLQTWVPYTSGSFENYARPALVHLYELEANCKAPPYIQHTIGANYAFLLALVAQWNAAHPGAPMRTITHVIDDNLNNNWTPTQIASQFDPIQFAMTDGATKTGAPRGSHIISIRVANPPPPHLIVWNASTTTAVGHAGAILGGGFVGGMMLAIATGRSANVVFDGAWHILQAWAKDALGAVEGGIKVSTGAAEGLSRRKRRRR